MIWQMCHSSRVFSLTKPALVGNPAAISASSSASFRLIKANFFSFSRLATCLPTSYIFLIGLSSLLSPRVRNCLEKLRSGNWLIQLRILWLSSVGVEESLQLSFDAPEAHKLSLGGSWLLYLFLRLLFEAGGRPNVPAFISLYFDVKLRGWKSSAWFIRPVFPNFFPLLLQFVGFVTSPLNLSRPFLGSSNTNGREFRFEDKKLARGLRVTAWGTEASRPLRKTIIIFFFFFTF